jgi:hypothetical protein
MEPVPLGRKRALCLKDSSKRQEILQSLRSFSLVRIWEKEGHPRTKWCYELYQRLAHTPHLVRVTPEHAIARRRDKSGREDIVTSFENRQATTYFFYLMTLHEKKVCCLVEQVRPLEKARIFLVRFRFREALFEGTLFHGSLVNSRDEYVTERWKKTQMFEQYLPMFHHEMNGIRQKNWFFLMYDVWVHKNKELTSSLSQRLVMIQDILHQDWMPDPRMEIAELDLVRYTNYSELESVMTREREYLSYATHEHQVVFVPVQGSPGRDECWVSILEKKTEPENDTMVFRNGEWNVQEAVSGKVLEKQNKETKQANLELRSSNFPDVYWVYHPRTEKNLGAALIKTLDESRVLRELFSQHKTIVLPCVFEDAFMKWRPMLVVKETQVPVASPPS